MADYQGEEDIGAVEHEQHAAIGINNNHDGDDNVHVNMPAPGAVDRPRT